MSDPSAVPQPKALEAEFSELFCIPDFYKVIKERGLRGDLRYSALRSLLWKILLEVLPPYVATSEWPQRIATSRKEYDALCVKYFVDPHEQPSSAACDPLSQSDDSSWNQFFKNEELLKEINKDIIRTYPEHEFFTKDETRQALTRVLFIYARDHPQVTYRQGMHELLAPIYYVAWIDAQAVKQEAPSSAFVRDTLAKLVDEKHLEADSYAIFCALMNHAAEFFLGSGSELSRAVNKEEDLSATPVVRRSRKIHNTLLKQKDPELYDLINKSGIEPQLYCMRWLKLLFGREFHLQDLLILWDAIFAYGRGLGLVDYICVAMLVYIRKQLVSMDQVTMMKRLLRYPPVEDITVFVQKAVELATPKSQQQQTSATPMPITRTPSPAPFMSSNSPPASAGILSAVASITQPIAAAIEQVTQENQIKQQQSPINPQHQQQTSRAVQQATAPLFGVVHQPSQAVPPQLLAVQQQHLQQAAAEIKTLKETVKRLQGIQEHSAARVDRLVYTLGQEITTNEALRDSETVIRSIAELKQIGAVLSGLLSDSPSDGDFGADGDASKSGCN